MSPVAGAPVFKLSAIHDFRSKLLQPIFIEKVKAYVLWQSRIRRNPDLAGDLRWMPDAGPISINLDLTTACNYACGHCVDMAILNRGIRHDQADLFHSLETMYRKGLRSVILIGGGEPTLDPAFFDTVEFLKRKKNPDIHIGIVTNGSRMDKIGQIGHLLEEHDWVRLSLDAGTNETFQAMHLPKGPITLEGICRNVAKVRSEHPNLHIGFSYIVTWKGAHTNDQDIVSNLHEMVPAAELARNHGFSCITYKPFLEIEPAEGKEILEIKRTADTTLHQILNNISEAKKLETEHFKVIKSGNMRILEEGMSEHYKKQPRHCHMTFFRQVFSPLGVSICPTLRGVEKGKLAGKQAYAGEANLEQARKGTAERIQNFDAAAECANSVCYWNDANWMLEDLIRHPEKLEELKPSPDRKEYFL